MAGGPRQTRPPRGDGAGAAARGGKLVATVHIKCELQRDRMSRTDFEAECFLREYVDFYRIAFCRFLAFS